MTNTKELKAIETLREKVEELKRIEIIDDFVEARLSNNLDELESLVSSNRQV